MAERDFIKWFNTSVSVESAIGVNSYGEVLYGASVVYPALVTYGFKVVRDKDGREVVSSARVYFDGTVPVSANSRLTMPDGTRPTVIAVNSVPDETGAVHHKVVVLG